MDNERGLSVSVIREIILMIEQSYRLLIQNLNVLCEIQENENSSYVGLHLLHAECLTTIAERTTPVRINNYVEFVMPRQTTDQFKENFRMSLDTFNILLTILGPQMVSANKFSPVTKLMNPRKQMLAVLWLLGTPDSYRSVAERFDMGKSSLHHSFMIFVKLLNSISSKIIKWHEGSTLIETVNKFKNFANISGVIGAIDGTYIPIKAPEVCPERYINRKCFYGITLQAICDANLSFIDIFAGYPSSVSDRRIFLNSDIHKNVSQGKIVIPPEHFIIGDKAYPIYSWCIPPFIDRGTLSNEEKLFNTAHAKTRQCIERAFALLKGRFRRLKYLDMSKTDFIPAVILACCVLHNICLTNEEVHENLLNIYIEEGRNTIVGEEEIDLPSTVNNEVETMVGTALRQRIVLDVN